MVQGFSISLNFHPSNWQTLIDKKKTLYRLHIHNNLEAMFSHNAKKSL